MLRERLQQWLQICSKGGESIAGYHVSDLGAEVGADYRDHLPTAIIDDRHREFSGNPTYFMAASIESRDVGGHERPVYRTSSRRERLVGDRTTRGARENGRGSHGC